MVPATLSCCLLSRLVPLAAAPDEPHPETSLPMGKSRSNPSGMCCAQGIQKEIDLTEKISPSASEVES